MMFYHLAIFYLSQEIRMRPYEKQFDEIAVGDIIEIDDTIQKCGGWTGSFRVTKIDIAPSDGKTKKTIYYITRIEQ